MLFPDVPDWAQVIVLAMIQGVAEFLPISSSGHVVVVSSLFGVAESAELNIVLHLGTLFSILLFYRKRIIDLLSVDTRVIKWLIIGTIPAAIIGIVIKTQFENLLESPLLAGFMLPITGGFLLLLRFLPAGKIEYQEISLRDVLIIGTFQAFALLPGISRSGSTISGWRVDGPKPAIGDDVFIFTGNSSDLGGVHGRSDQDNQGWFVNSLHSIIGRHACGICCRAFCPKLASQMG